MIIKIYKKKPVKPSIETSTLYILILVDRQVEVYDYTLYSSFFVFINLNW